MPRLPKVSNVFTGNCRRRFEINRHIDFGVNVDATGLVTDLEMKMIDQLHLVEDFEVDNLEARRRVDISAFVSRLFSSAADGVYCIGKHAPLFNDCCFALAEPHQM